jgi:transposase InsO family protein
MDTESQRIYDRMTLHRLSLKHPDWKSAQLAEATGRSERWVRKWLGRFADVEEPHFSMYLSQSRAPKTRPRQTSEAVKDVICELRETLSEEYHRPAGAALIHHYLQQDERLKGQALFIPTSSRTITRILRERGYIQPPKKYERHPLERCAPMEEWEMDFCEIWLEDGKFEFFLVVDRGTSRVVYLEGCDGYRAASAIMAVCRLFLLNGLPKRLRFDRDPRFVWSWTADSFPAPLIRFLHVLGIEPVICPPRRPDKKPYVERCVRTFKHEWLDRFSLNTMADCYEALEAFPDYHNRERIHMGRACQGKTPDDAFPDLPILPALPQTVAPNRWLQVEHGRVFRRRIRSNGTIQVDKHTYYIDQKLAKRSVLVHLDGDKRCLRVSLDGQPHPKRLPLKELHPDEMALQDYLKILQDEAMSIAYYRHTVWMQSAQVA